MPSALVVGGGSGLGLALARALLARGWSVRIVCRTAESAGALERTLPAGRWKASVCDLSDAAAVERLCRDPWIASEAVDLCILAAGRSEAGYADDLPTDAFRRCMEVNFLSPVALLSALSRAERPCRRFVLILSGACGLLVPGLAPYALSKRMLRDYLYFLEMERSFPGCRILSVWPGKLATRFDEKTVLHGTFRLPKIGRRERLPEEVAERILCAEAEGRRRLSLAPLPLLLGKLQTLAPKIARRLLGLHPAFRRSS